MHVDSLLTEKLLCIAAILAARDESAIGRAHGACEIWVRGAAQREIKARGGGDAGTSLTTSNAEIALGLRTQVPSGSGGAGASAALALLDDVPASPASRAWGLGAWGLQ